jgi:8-oxo-dGTP diphosphatase
MENRYPLAVTGSFIIDKGKVLLIKFNDKKGSWSGKWSVPGGKVEFGERVIDAVMREAKEETGLDVEPTELISVDEAIVGEEKHYIFLNFVCEVKGGTLGHGSDAAAIGWFSKDDLGKIELNHPSIERALRKIGFL